MGPFCWGWGQGVQLCAPAPWAEAEPLTAAVSFYLGFAIGVQQLHPTLIQRTYG